jgi:dihydrofolate reductase
MTANTNRKMISAMQVSLDGFIADNKGQTDWVDSWADAIQLMDDVDMFGKNIYVVGGGSLVSSLMDAHLIDELRLIVHPIIIGSGKPLFSVTQRHALELVQTQPDKSGRVILTYRVC